MTPTAPQSVLSTLWDRITAFRLFCHEDYARRYLGWAAYMPFAFAHYLLIGERRGHLPNPFFDPVFFERQSGTRSLLRYLFLSRYWDHETSSCFDPAFYRCRSGLPSDRNPLSDFWTRGFDKRYRPSSSFDVGFFRDVVCRGQWSDRKYTYVLFTDPDYRPATNLAEHIRRRECFVAGLSYRVLTSATETDRRYLVFVQANATFDASWIDGPRDFDILLNYYEEPIGRMPGVEMAIVQSGTKSTAIRRVLERDPDYLLRYEAVFFIDDDIDIDGAAISRLFAATTTEGFDLAQPSLTADSACFFDCLKQPVAGPENRRLSAVEIMMPVVSRRALQRLGWVFAEGVSGWGVDLLLGAKVREMFGDTVGLVGGVVAAHRQAVDTIGGRFYTFLRGNGIDANAEAGYIIQTFGLGPEQSSIAYLPAAARCPGRPTAC